MKLFNKQRFQLLKGSKMRKYLAYAIGEIILVIIGILIALGISNWNQNKVLENSNKELQEKALAQLEKDIESIENFQKELDTMNQTYRKVLDREYDKNKVDEAGLISTILFEVNTLSLDRHFNNLVDNAELDSSDATKELIEINNMYKLYLKNIDDVDDLIFKRITDNLTEIEKTQDWYTELITDFVCKNDCINYLLNDEGHKSRIASLRFLCISGYGGIIDSFHEDLVESKVALEKAMDI